MTPELSTSRLRSERRHKSRLSWLGMLSSISITVLAYVAADRALEDRLRAQFTLRTDELVQVIQGRTGEHEVVLRGIAALFRASERVTRAEFREYVRHLQMERYFPGIQALGFAKWLRGDEVLSAEQAIRAEGFPEFTIRPPGARATATPIMFIEPFVGRNLRAFGYDMWTETERRAAMTRAIETGLPSATRIVRLIQETTKDVQPGFLIYLAIFGGAGNALGEGPRAPLGFAYIPVRTGDLLQAMVGESSPDIDYAIFEAGSRTAFFDSRRRGGGVAETPELSSRRVIAVAGQSWTLRFWSRPHFEPWISRSGPLWVLAVGIVINLLLLYILASSWSLQQRAQALAAGMTQALTQSHAREQAQMVASLTEKETLLKEIHHRVKNNLQVVSSLLSLQQNYTLESAALEPLVQSQRRVLAMAALHEFLYQSKDLSHVDTRAYLSHLIAMLAEAVQAAPRVSLTLELDEVPLDMDQAIPCGLITSELVSNAFKHAFVGRTEGRLAVRLYEREEKVTLEVEDDGQGLASAVQTGAPSTLGLQLVQLLTDQLGGQLKVVSGAGTRFRVSFPRKDRARRASTDA